MMPAPEADQKLVDDLAETSEGLSWRLSPRMIAALGAPTASSSAAAVALSTSVPAAGASGAPASGAPMMSDARPPTQPRAGMRTRMGRNVGPIGGGTLASAAAGMAEDGTAADVPAWTLSPGMAKVEPPASTSSVSDWRALTTMSFDKDDWDLLANMGNTPRNAVDINGAATPRTRAAASACRARRAKVV